MAISHPTSIERDVARNQLHTYLRMLATLGDNMYAKCALMAAAVAEISPKELGKAVLQEFDTSLKSRHRPIVDAINSGVSPNLLLWAWRLNGEDSALSLLNDLVATKDLPINLQIITLGLSDESIRCQYLGHELRMSNAAVSLAHDSVWDKHERH